MGREYPAYPVLAVGGIVWDRDRVLLVRRAKEPGRGQWSIPGGGVRLGERLEAAVEREVKEETGLRVRAIQRVHVVERIVPHEGRIRYHYVIVDYACRLEEGTLEAGSDAAEVGWFEPTELDGLGLSKETLRVIELARLARREPAQGGHWPRL
jgi:ADP-ribose pyrophosphatase YjhB (NUDIX family)